MAAKQTRKAISLSADVYAFVEQMAKEQDIPCAHLVTELIRSAFNGVPSTQHMTRDAARKAVRRRRAGRSVITGRAVVRRIAGMM
jgi:hypothetical protein